MDHVRIFLESSSIHGLAHISRNRKLKQTFWLIVVVVGFISAFFLIYTSFQSWHESPVKTMTETLPISEMKLPKVTVCPPKNTFTDLNYDLKLAENRELTDAKRDELYKFAIENTEENTYMDALNQLQEKNRFYNWYYGYSTVEPPSDEGFRVAKIITTSALSGSIATVKYGQQLKPELVWGDIFFLIHLLSNSTNQNVTLHIEVEKMSMIGLLNGKERYIVNNCKTLEATRISMHNKFNPPGYTWYAFNLDRSDVSREDIRNLDMRKMPGFIFRWYYTGGNLSPIQVETKYNPYHDDFIRYIWLRQELKVSQCVSVRSAQTCLKH